MAEPTIFPRLTAMEFARFPAAFDTAGLVKIESRLLPMLMMLSLMDWIFCRLFPKPISKPFLNSPPSSFARSIRSLKAPDRPFASLAPDAREP